MKKNIFLLYFCLIFLSACLSKQNQSTTTPGPVQPVFPAIPIPDTFVRSNSVIHIKANKNIAYNNSKIYNLINSFFEPLALALENTITLITNNSYKSDLELDVSNLAIPPSIDSSVLSFGTFSIKVLSDQQLTSCAGSRCNFVFIRAYTKNQKGLYNSNSNSNADLYINDILIGSDTPSYLQQQPLDPDSAAFTSADLVINTDYNVNVNFSNLPTGSYETDLVFEYGLLNNSSTNLSPSLSLNNFNGGQVVAGGTTQEVKWTATDDNFFYKPISIDYSSDNGLSWNTVASYIGNSSSYFWTIPSIDSNNCLLRLKAVDLSGNVTVVKSFSPFAIDSTAPSLALSGVTQNQTISGGSALAINWSASDTHLKTFPIKLEYTVNNGEIWILIADTLANSGSFSWQTPNLTSQAQVRITASDTAGNNQTVLSPIFNIIAN